MKVAQLPPLEVPPRLEALRTRCAELGVDAVLITDPANVRYLTGFTGSAGRLAVTASGAMLATDGRYREQSVAQLGVAEVADAVDVVVGTVPEQDLRLAGLLADLCVGLEADFVPWADAQAWIERLASSEVMPVTDVLVPIRAIKDPGEVARIEAAAQIADAALAECVHLLGEGPTELEFARTLDHHMLTAGADALSFETICASGPNGALPHARPSSRRVRPGDLVVIDFGAMVDGYHSDMTRTFVIDDPDADAAAMIEAVTTAQELGVRAVTVGAVCSDVDRACREHLEGAGFGHEFVHGTGHGVGLMIHEAPWVNSRSDTELRPGHVVTVEPGVYRPGFGGVRVEDTVLVTQAGARRLTAAPKEPVIPAGPSPMNSWR